MSINTHALGKIFISHSSADKPFVRSLSEKINNSGYSVWLDERDLIVGDPIAEKISKAIEEARIVFVVVSKASIASKWLKYELNIATDRMIQGECRVIPVIKEKVELPPEVKGLLYADCTSGIKDGIRAILTALEHETRRRAWEIFWRRAESLIEQIFEHTGYVSTGGEYKGDDYEVIYLPIKDDDENEVTVVFESVSNYLDKLEPLSELWWSEYKEAMLELSESYFLLLTQRPFNLQVGHTHPNSSRVHHSAFKYDHLDFVTSDFFVVDLSGIDNLDECKKHMLIAKELIHSTVHIRVKELRIVRSKGNA
ncbi:MAG: toll/interleukin-1 receptor domain-containing protein [Calditrichia bacterium]|nr:toll/interleukin-1 receptor domain-containing protein [Calditrichia bacterium]